MGRSRPVEPKKSSRSIGPGGCLAPVGGRVSPATTTVTGNVRSTLEPAARGDAAHAPQ
jgi:hypothetical protein